MVAIVCLHPIKLFASDESKNKGDVYIHVSQDHSFSQKNLNKILDILIRCQEIE